MAKKKLNCEVLTSVKGLIKDKPQERLTAGTADNPTLIDLFDNDETRGLIKAEVLRIYPGPPAESEEVKAANLVSLKKAEKALPALLKRYGKDLEAATEDADKKKIEAAIVQVEEDLALVQEALR